MLDLLTRLPTTNTWALQSSVKYNWSVFPVAANSKKPLAGTHGKNDATNNYSNILYWYSLDPNMNFGYNLDMSGLSVIDVDCHGETDGLNALNNLIADDKVTKQELLSALIQLTPSGGIHFIFRTWKPFKQMQLGSYKSALKGIDLLNQGCSVMCAGARINNVVYTLCNRIPELDEIGYFPKRLFEYMQQLRPERIYRGVAPVRSKLEIKLPAYDGCGRNVWLARCAGYLKQCKEITTQYDLFQELLYLNHSLDKPLTDGEVHGIAKSIFNRR